jgi:peptidoglycan/LPS O-acetylase OafA/YrhL
MARVISQDRKHYIDWLRVLAMLTIFFFHSARYFDQDGWHVKNPQTFYGFTVFVVVISQWIMPLFFMLSSMSSRYSLAVRATGRYTVERIKRLGVPLVFGIFTLALPQVYIERHSAGKFAGSLMDFIPHYFDGFYAFGGNFAWMGLHLWYLEVLLIFSLLTLPLFRAIISERGEYLLSSLSAVISSKPVFIYLLFIPIALMEMIINLQPNGIGIRDFGGWSPFSYLVFFITGFILAVKEDFTDSMMKLKFPSIALAAVLTVAGYLIHTYGISDRSVLFASIRSFNSWCWLCAIIGWGKYYLTFSNKFLVYANEAVLPFYMLHQTVIVIVGYFLINLNLPVILKYVILALLSFVLIMLIYEFIVRRFGVLRFLFGMKT